ncbi:hypothetical protein K2173_001167 [Erythroxylum novogranatense]|uniref:PI3K/PI4K catalytic domain-containing protein n=1 Tax=Erythroxylum novogranatense TaxID=1862640 RepID=A0AAV8TIA4_9ROSI|nr:hypothetical protein K2173_001167 [Erythroxylum novogranatense]
MMQGLPQQLAALLSAALPTDDGDSSSSTSTASPDDAARVAAINSLHRAILYPPNSLLVAHSASFLSQGLLQLLSDKSYSVRQSAASAYGAMCGVVCSILATPNGRQNHVMLWLYRCPLLEFFSVGDVVGVERYAVSVLKACQGLLEDERTSLNLLHHLLGVLTLISLKFSRLFQPHFLDIVDLLLGWVLVPDLKEADRHVILDSFLQFQKHWVGNLHFSLGLLSKFLDDMDVLIQDGSHGTLPHFRRLLALLSCFSTVLQSTASGLLEMNCLEQITEPLSKMIPRLLGCLSVVGRKFGWSKWTGNLWKCLTLLAEILREKFSSFYPVAVDILFQSLDMSATTLPGAERITSIQVHEILKTNLQLLSLQKFGLQSSSVQKVLSFDAPISHLRLHPNHLVIGSCTATYIFMLQHGNDEVVHQAMTVLIEELVLLKDLLQRSLDLEYAVEVEKNGRYYSTHELVALVKFDLKVLNTIGHPDIVATYVKRSERLSSFILEKLDAFGLPVAAYIELQVDIIRAMNRLTAIELWGRYSVKIMWTRKIWSVPCQSSASFFSLAVKVVALEWTQRFCENLITLYPNFDITTDLFGARGYINSVSILVFSVFDAASDREPEVRSRVALVLELLFQARLVIPMHFNATAELVLENLLSYMLPLTIYFCGLCDQEIFVTRRPNALVSSNRSNLRWKQLFALKQLERHLNSQQLVSILSYISQRWKVPLSSWIQRLVSCCRNTKDYVLGQHEETKKSETSFLWFDVKVENDLLERTCMVNNHAGAWWAIHEAARYCIATRRTNLGGPTQTFAALERMLLDIALVLQLDNEQNDGNAGLMGSSGTHLLPMRLLLDFVEALKKNVYNAYEGSAILPSATPQSSLFFRANKKVCEEWFSRICEPMMNAGLALQCHDATVQYCSLRLQDLKGLLGSSLKEKSRMHLPENLRNIRDKFSGDVLRILRHMALALCKSHEPEALIGLQNWVSMTFSLLFVDENNSLNHSATFGPLAWISGLVYQAQGQSEKAAAHFTHLLQNEESLNSLGSEGVQFSIERVIESYTAICDWRSLESWLLQLQTLRSKHAGKSCSGALTTAGNEINAIHALANFDEGDFQSAWSYLDLTPKSSNELTLDPKLALQRVNKCFYRQFNAGRNIGRLPLDGLAEAVPYATQLHCIVSFEEGYKLHGTQASIKQHASILALYVESEKSLINRVLQDCNQWLKVFRVYRTVFPNSLVTLKLCLSLSSLAINRYEDAFANLWSFIRLVLMVAKDYPDLLLENVIRKVETDFSMDEKFSGGNSGHAVDIEMSNFKSTLHVLVEEIVGTATKLSTKLCPRMGKSWMSYASWCFNQAKCSLFTSHENVLSSCSLSPILHEEVLPNRFNLTEDERKQVQYVILQLFQNSCDDCDNKGGEGKLWPDSALMLQVINIIEDAAGAPGAENSKRDLSSAIDDLVNVWWSLRRRRVNLFGHAAYGFMQFLRYSSQSLNSKSASYTLRATLYLLHILLNYGVELKDTIGPALSTIPLFPWQEVTPQLFARLSSHPEQVVRKQLEGVILMLAKLSPWSIVYPTLVDVKAYGEKPSEELHCILECLREFYPRLIQDVQLMINELENVTVLWEELWLSTLQDLHADVMRRINLLKDEATRIAENPTLTENEKTKINAAKYSAMMAPIVVALERRLASTSRKPETPHEMWFNEEYRERLKSAISKFKTAPTSVTALAEVWRPFHDIASSLASYQRKSSINLREVAPQLALLPSSDVPMPGLEKEVLASEPESGLAASLQGIVTIASFAEQVTILSTKTKPKKLVILGSDGEKYTYLLKGGEDLRLDARIMQLLHTLNSILVHLLQLVLIGLASPLFCNSYYSSGFNEGGSRQLLHQELWCASEGFKAFSSKLRRYAGSVAAMSMVGHILGLGDRHLDNILVDFCSGDVVHIDYNVCFDKGQRLKVPEIVPFRLTQMIEAALGLTGVEGTFRANCEAVLGVLRKNKDIILMLLEVFIWDPLVEWTRGDLHDDAAIGGEERKGMELAVSLSLFASRVQEIRVPLQEHHDLLLATLPAVESALERFADALHQYEVASALFIGLIKKDQLLFFMKHLQSRLLLKLLVIQRKLVLLLKSVMVAGVPLTIVPEPTLAQFLYMDGHKCYKCLQMPSSDILSLARRQAAELITKAHGNVMDSVRYTHGDLCFKVEKYVAEISKLEEECIELVNSVGSETETKPRIAFYLLS